MIYELKKFSYDVGTLEYEMYQEIPMHENGAENYANGLSLKEFKKFVKSRIDEEFISIDENNTPRIVYILYVDSYPVGEIALRPFLNNYWFQHSGHIGYKVRPSERHKGYGTAMLRMLLDEARTMCLTEVYLQCHPSNFSSARVILKNKGVLVEQNDNILRYKILL